MKHNFIRRVLSVMLSCSVMVLGSVNVSSEEITVSNALGIYERKFELLNEKYGTDFQIATFDMTEAELNDLLMSYLNMTDEEFEEYFLDMKEKCEYFLQEQSENHVIYSERDSYSSYNIASDVTLGINDTTYNVEEDAMKGFVTAYSQDINNKNYNVEEINMENIVTPYSTNVTEVQHYYYNSSNNNNLYITSTVNYSAGWGQYISVNSYSSHVDSYPAYKVRPSGFTYTINSYYQKCDAVCSFPCYLYVSDGVTSGSLQNIGVTFSAGWGDIYAA